jgi:hypothetical protein
MFFLTYCSDLAKTLRTLTFIRRTNQVLSNRHLTNAPNWQSFTCPIHSYGSLELKPHLLSPHYIIVCGQIHTPATLPNYVHLYLLNSSFSACLYFSKPHVCCYAKATEFFHYPLQCNALQQFLRAKLHSLCQALLLQEHLNDSILCSRIFLLCTPCHNVAMDILLCFYPEAKTERDFM